jgi:hypothetical protein
MILCYNVHRLYTYRIFIFMSNTMYDGVMQSEKIGMQMKKCIELLLITI